MPRVRLGIVSIGLSLLIVAACGAISTSAASAFATAAFQTQWQQAEAITPNFWGPLSIAQDGQQEPYAEAPGGQRLVQYFDKARMEQFDPNAHVTTGLLTVELKSGKVQRGDNTFEQHTPAQIVLAGDPSADSPTYADLGQLAESYPDSPTTPSAYVYNPGHTFHVMTTQEGQQYAAQFDVPSGRDTFQYRADPAHRFGQYVYTPFIDFTDHLTASGISLDQTPGYAISPVIVAQVPVGGKSTTVFMQAFERRVLTYNPNNPVEFRVEFGNIGQHYFTWRYGASGATAPVQSVAPVAPTPTAPPAATQPTGAAGVTFLNVTSPISAGNVASVTVKTAPGAVCTISVTYKSGISTAKGLDPKTADANGMVSWSWMVGTNTTPGSWPIDVTCSVGGQSASQRTSFTVT